VAITSHVEQDDRNLFSSIVVKPFNI
jgi:hypothetical protein